ncbi:hypothetical protein [Microbacterium luteum]|uniref:hypothetical protein n=1 Tax=Microbacterium luteum TaxID=2782167 RepID=UPI0018883032|nr:hypothetical protein [Microbacterium luteum]
MAATPIDDFSGLSFRLISAQDRTTTNTLTRYKGKSAVTDERVTGQVVTDSIFTPSPE